MLFCLNAKEAKALHFVFVSSFRFQVCGTKSREVLHRVFLKWFVLREVHRDWHVDETDSLMRSADDGGFF